MATRPEEGKTSEHDNVIRLGAISKNKMNRFFPKEMDSEFPKAMLVVLFFFLMLMGGVGFLVGMRVCELSHMDKKNSSCCVEE
jgi:hypothetical protein